MRADLKQRLSRFVSSDLGLARRTDARLNDAGWASRFVYDVPGSDPPLSVKLRLPSGVTLLDVGALTAATETAPPWARQAAASLRDLAPETRIVVCSACVGHDDPGDVLFVLTIVHAPVTGSPAMQVPEVDPDDHKVSQTVKQLSDRVTLVDRLSVAQTEPGGPEKPMLVDTYLVQTPHYGGLSVSFTTTHDGMFTEAAAGIYFQVVNTMWIGEGHPPD